MRRHFDSRTVKSLPEAKRTKFLNLLAIEQDSQYYEFDKLAYLQRADQEARIAREENEYKTKEQIKVLTDMYTEQARVSLIYGANSQQNIILERQIEEYSKGLTYQAGGMTSLNIAVNAYSKVYAELRKDPVNVARIAENRITETMTPHDREKIRVFEKDGWYREYRSSISRAFEQDGQMINIHAHFMCTAYIGKDTLTAAYYSRRTTERNQFRELNTPTEQIFIDIPRNRSDLVDYLNEKLTILFGEGAEQLSLDNFFNWYDSVIKDVEIEEKQFKIRNEHEGKIKQAMELEKEDDMDYAIKLYEEVINDGYAERYPYNRLAIIYRKKAIFYHKKKQYEDEVDVVQRAIEMLVQIKNTSLIQNITSKLEKFKKRLDVANELAKRKRNIKI